MCLLPRGAHSPVQRSFILPCHREWIGSVLLSHLAELIKDTVSIKVLPAPVFTKMKPLPIRFCFEAHFSEVSVCCYSIPVSSMGLFHN